MSVNPASPPSAPRPKIILVKGHLCLTYISITSSKATWHRLHSGLGSSFKWWKARAITSTLIKLLSSTTLLTRHLETLQNNVRTNFSKQRCAKLIERVLTSKLSQPYSIYEKSIPNSGINKLWNPQLDSIIKFYSYFWKFWQFLSIFNFFFTISM